jgi:hypothetical protein
VQDSCNIAESATFRATVDYLVRKCRYFMACLARSRLCFHCANVGTRGTLGRWL